MGFPASLLNMVKWMWISLVFHFDVKANEDLLSFVQILE